MTLPGGDEKDTQQRLFRYTLIGIIGQVGCLTILIILGAVFAGLWLDRYFQTNRLITFVLVIASIPVSLLVMFFVVRAGLARLKPRLTNKVDQDEEADIGGGNTP